MLMKTIEGHDDDVNLLTAHHRFCTVVEMMACASNPKKNLEGDTSVMTYRGHLVLQTQIRCHISPEFTTGQRYIYTGCAAGRVVIYDVLTGKVHSVLSGHTGCVRDVSWHPHRLELVSTSWDRTLGKWTYSGQMKLDVENEDISFMYLSDKGFRQQKSQEALEQKRTTCCSVA